MVSPGLGTGPAGGPSTARPGAGPPLPPPPPAGVIHPEPACGAAADSLIGSTHLSRWLLLLLLLLLLLVLVLLVVLVVLRWPD